MFKWKIQCITFCFIVVMLFLNSCSKEDTGSSTITFEPRIASIAQNVCEDSIQKYVQTLEDMGTRFALADNRRDVAMSILEKFESIGYTNVKLDSFLLYDYTAEPIWQYNVVATLTGVVYPDSISIIGGHHDCIISYGTGNSFDFAPGANDNASGVATTLEVARVLKKVDFRPKTTIKFVTFAAEELGLYGSYDYAGKSLQANSKIKMMLNNDMVAYWSNPDTSNWCVNILDYTNSTSLRKKAQEVCKLYTSLKTNNDNTYQEYSDSYPFALKGYKAIFFISNADDENYHTPNDLTTQCNFKFCREVAKVNCVLLIENNFAD